MGGSISPRWRRGKAERWVLLSTTICYIVCLECKDTPLLLDVQGHGRFHESLHMILSTAWMSGYWY